MNRLFVAKKPAGISSNFFLSRLKRKYSQKKAGFSGTLDPFASGVLLVAFGSYPRLFNYLEKSPKLYRATLWIGAFSPSGDNENIEFVQDLRSFHIDVISQISRDLSGTIKYTPPKFSAKKINGERAYNLARKGCEFSLKECEMQVFSVKILHYRHPFLSMELSVSEGSYIRSWAELFGRKLGVKVTLSALERLREGEFTYENEKSLNPLEFIKLKRNEYLGPQSDIEFGKKLNLQDFRLKDNGVYLLEFEQFFSIIEVSNGEVKYKLNKVENASFD